MSFRNMTIFQIFGVIVAGWGLWDFVQSLKTKTIKECVPKLIIYCVVAAFATNLNEMVYIGQKIITITNSLLGSVKFKA